MIYLSFMIIILKYRLSSMYRSRNLNILSSTGVLLYNRRYNRIFFDMFMSFSLKINTDIFFLNCRLDISGSIVMCSRSLNGLNSFGGFINWFFSHRLSGLFSLRTSVKFNSLSVVYNFFIVNRLSQIFLCRDGNFSSFSFVLSYSWSSNRIMIYNFCFTSLNIYNLLNGFDNRLNVSFFNGNLSRNFDINVFSSSLIINNRIFCNSLSINRSLNNFSSFYWGLNNSLFDNRLRNDSLGNNRLRDYFSSKNRFIFNSLCLSDSRLAIINHISNLRFIFEVSSRLPFTCFDFTSVGSFSCQFPFSSSRGVRSGSRRTILHRRFKLSSKSLRGRLLVSVYSYIFGSRS